VAIVSVQVAEEFERIGKGEGNAHRDGFEDEEKDLENWNVVGVGVVERRRKLSCRVLAPGSAHARPSDRPPIDIRRNFLAHMSAESPSNISPNPQKSYPKFRNPRTTFENTPLYPPNI
jgi:hypothetical protein